MHDGNVQPNQLEVYARTLPTEEPQQPYFFVRSFTEADWNAQQPVKRNHVRCSVTMQGIAPTALHINLSSLDLRYLPTNMVIRLDAHQAAQVERSEYLWYRRPRDNSVREGGSDSCSDPEPDLEEDFGLDADQPFQAGMHDGPRGAHR